MNSVDEDHNKIDVKLRNCVTENVDSPKDGTGEKDKAATQNKPVTNRKAYTVNYFANNTNKFVDNTIHKSV